MRLHHKSTLQSFSRFFLVSMLTVIVVVLKPSITLAKDIVLVLEESSIAQGKNGLPSTIRNSWGQSILKNSAPNEEALDAYKNSEFKYVEWGLESTPESLAADIESKVSSADHVRTVVISAHGNPRALVFGNVEKLMTGSNEWANIQCRDVNMLSYDCLTGVTLANTKPINVQTPQYFGI